MHLLKLLLDRATIVLTDFFQFIGSSYHIAATALEYVIAFSTASTEIDRSALTFTRGEFEWAQQDAALLDVQLGVQLAKVFQELVAEVIDLLSM